MYCPKKENKEELTKATCLECLIKKDANYHRDFGWMHRGLATEIRRGITKLAREVKLEKK